MPEVVVIGAGFGGLAAALTLADAGAKVTLCEQLKYPGGCASTFRRAGCAFEAGATLFSGFGQDQLFGRWIERFELPVRFQTLNPVIHFRSPALCLDVPATKERFVAALCALEGAPVRALRAFFELQGKVSESLWPCFDQPGRLPPFRDGGLRWQLGRLGRYPRLLTLMGRSLDSVLARYSLDRFTPLRDYLRALCQITLQVESDEAEAPFALAVCDYPFRGTGHIEGGVGALAEAMLDAIRARSGEVQLCARVRRIERDGARWRVTTRGGELRADSVVANLLPQALTRLLPEGSAAPRLDALARRVEGGWGAAMLYLVIDDHPALPRGPSHFQLVAEGHRPLRHGHHVFCSLSGAGEPGRAPDGQRAATVSTHVDLEVLRALEEPARGPFIAEIQERMRALLAAQLPELSAQIHLAMPASPRTFARFTGRTDGLVGGVPRRVGLHNYRGLLPRPLTAGLWLVGDSVFPGQSTLATSVGGVRCAQALLARGR